MAALLAALVLASLPASGEPDLDALTAALASWRDAREAGEPAVEARAEIARLLAAAARESGEHPLAGASLLGRALCRAQAQEAPDVRGGKVVEAESPKGEFAGGTLRYAFRTPRDYDPEERTYPLVLTLPAPDERPAEHIRVHWSDAEFREGAIVLCPEMPADVDVWSRVVVAGRPGGLTHVLTALRLAGERLAVDFDRVFVAGRESGVAVALAAGDQAPHLFAGVVARAGSPGEVGPANLRNLPVLFQGVGAEARAFEEKARELGIEGVTLQPTGDATEAWEWIQEHPRAAHPTRADIVVGNPFPTRVHWLRVSPIDPAARASVELDRRTNTVRIDASGVSHVTLYLNDALLDLGHPVSVVHGEDERTVDVHRSLSLALDLLADGTSDPACVYTAELTVPLRADAARGGSAADSVPDAEVRAKLREAAGDVEALRGVHAWCVANERPAGSRAALRRILLAAPDDEEAHRALGHELFAGTWFRSPHALARHRTDQDPAVAERRGWVLHKGTWMHPDDRTQVGRGLVRDPETGLWLDAKDRRRLADGWVRQDLEWIAPDEAHHVADGEWRVDGEWLSLAEAERRRARIERRWRIPTPDALLHATVARDIAERAVPHVSRAIDDLRLVFGVEPQLPLEVAILRDEEQYDTLAFGEPDGRRPPAHAGRLHVIPTAFFAESWFERVARKRESLAMGVCYWNADIPYGDAYGVHAVRLATGLSYVDAIDPSPDAVRRAVSKGVDADYYADWCAEKRLPEWLRFGGAVYAERFFHDPDVAEGGDPWWARKWSLANLAGRGGLRGLSEVFEFELDPDAREESLNLLVSAGALVAFALDGGCEPVTAAHAELRDALRAGRMRPSHVEALEDALRANEERLRLFARP